MPDAGSICFVARLVIPSATDGAHLSHCALHKLFNATIGSEISHYEVSRKLAAQGVIRFAVSGERHIGFDLHVNLLGDCVQTPALRRNALES
jgi:hypothetical protein